MKMSTVALAPWLLKPPLLKPTPPLANSVQSSVTSQVSESLGWNWLKVRDLAAIEPAGFTPGHRPGLIGALPV